MATPQACGLDQRINGNAHTAKALKRRSSEGFGWATRTLSRAQKIRRMSRVAQPLVGADKPAGVVTVINAFGTPTSRYKPGAPKKDQASNLVVPIG